MRLVPTLMMALLLTTGCLSANKTPQGGDPGGNDPGKDGFVPPMDLAFQDFQPPQDPGTSDPGAADPGGVDLYDPGCPDFEIKSFGTVNGARHVAFDQRLDVVSGVTWEGTAPTITLDFQPAGLAAYWHDEGNGVGWFQQTAVDAQFPTTEVSLTLTVSAGGCQDQAEFRFKVLGSVWIAENDGNVVQVFRSDGEFLVQGLPSTYLKDPWELIQLGPDRIGVGNRHQGGVEVYDLDGNHVGAFDTDDDKGSYLYSIYGAYGMIRHRPDNTIWVVGPRGKLLVYQDDGQWLETRYLGNVTLGELTPEDIVQLPDDTTVLVGDKSWAWDMVLLDANGDTIGPWGNNKEELELQVFRATTTPDGQVAVSGKVGLAVNKAFVAILKPAGQMVRYSDPLPDFKKSYGILAFGDGFLVTTDADTVVHLDKDLKVVTTDWTQGKAGTYRGLMVLGGN